MEGEDLTLRDYRLTDMKTFFFVPFKLMFELGDKDDGRGYVLLQSTLNSGFEVFRK